MRLKTGLSFFVTLTDIESLFSGFMVERGRSRLVEGYRIAQRLQKFGKGVH